MTLLMAETKTVALVFVSFPFFLPVSQEKVALVSGKLGFSFWFQLWAETRGEGFLAHFAGPWTSTPWDHGCPRQNDRSL